MTKFRLTDVNKSTPGSSVKRWAADLHTPPPRRTPPFESWWHMGQLPWAQRMRTLGLESSRAAPLLGLRTQNCPLRRKEVPGGSRAGDEVHHSYIQLRRGLRRFCPEPAPGTHPTARGGEIKPYPGPGGEHLWCTAVVSTILPLQLSLGPDPPSPHGVLGPQLTEAGQRGSGKAPCPRSCRVQGCVPPRCCRPSTHLGPDAEQKLHPWVLGGWMEEAQWAHTGAQASLPRWACPGLRQPPLWPRCSPAGSSASPSHVLDSSDSIPRALTECPLNARHFPRLFGAGGAGQAQLLLLLGLLARKD